MLKSIREAVRRGRHKRKGVPEIKGPSHETLRGRHEGGVIAVLGSAPSSPAALQYAREKYGDKLVIVGMNASSMIAKPRYHVFADAVAVLQHGLLLDPAASIPVIQPSALAKITKDHKPEHAEVVKHLRAVAASPATIRLERDNKAEQRLHLDMKLRVLAGRSAGSAALQLAMLMLLPPLNETGDWAHPPKPGKLVIIGYDGYEMDKAWHFYSAADEKREDLSERNMYQSAVLIQIVMLARLYGIAVVNLSKRGAIDANELCRDGDFDRG